MKTSKKFGDTSVRVLETLKFLSENDASIQDIITHFEKIDPNNRIYTSEVILKYINTLKVFGFKFIKNKDKYVLLNTPNQFDFDERDLKAIALIENLSKIFPEKGIKTETDKFLQELEKRFSDNTKLLSQNTASHDFGDLEINYNKYSAQIKEHEKYCLEGQRLKITYKNHNEIASSIMIEPNEIKYMGNEVYLSVYNPISAQIQDINFNSIIKVEQLPLKSNRTNMFSSVTFMLKDRLAKGYRLHDGEKLLQIKSDGGIIILNQKEDKTLLLKRLMRYGENCKVVSPKTLREEMRQMVEAALNNYR
ncbi:MAG: WYL domain-containing protein [Candidatus Gastranaerophilaceae bacterium]